MSRILVPLSLSFFASVAVAMVQPWFTAPYSGEKVHEYEVTLPISRYEKQTFRIPRDCKKLNSALLEGAGHWGNRVERRLWLKADDDCRYLNYLNQYPGEAKYDFVSNYDFMNARIQDLPLRPGCDLYILLHSPDACPPPLPGLPDFGMMMHMGMGNERPASPFPDEDPQACRFRNGVFRGYITPTPEGIRCRRDDRAPGYRILSVDFADVNGDGYLDAVLRMSLIGTRRRPELLVLPLTRFAPDQPFSLPQGTEHPRLGPTNEGYL